MANLTNYGEALLLKALFKADVAARTELADADIQMALVTATPSDATENISSASEVTGGDYDRIEEATMASAFPVPTEGTMTNTSDLSWGPSSTSWGTVQGVVWVDVQTGKVLVYHALSSGIVVGGSNTVSWTAGNLTLEMA